MDTSGDLSQVVAETDADGNLTASYVRGHDLISVESGEEKWYYVCDGRGSVRHLLDEEGTVTDSYSYDAYGMLLTKSGDTDNSYMYVGEEYNANTGLYYLRARYMNPSTGSFTTMDSYQGSLYEPISLHKYAYANANPVSNIDPSGYTATSIPECVVVQAEQKNIRDIVQIQALRKVMSWANLACTTYDICVALREMFLNDADSFAIFHSILRGMIIDQLVDCLLSGPVKIVAKAIMICKELGDQVDTIKYDLEQGDYISAGIHAIQLLVIIFSIMAQCFTGETEVMTDEGLIAIEDIEIGDYVLAEDTVTGEQEYKEALNVFVSQTNKLVHVTTDSGSETTTEITTETTINTTDNHPFYVEGKGWVPAIELEAGDELRTANGEIETVSKVEVEYLDEAVLIYNLEVEGYHTYFVSDESVLVHNSYESGDGGNGNSEGGSDSGNYVYRALNQKDYERYTNGLGLEAKNPNGNWGLKEHLVDGSGKLSWVNDPYISTTSDLSVAKGFNQSGSGYGIVKIDLNKVNSPSYKGYEIYLRVNGKEGLPYHYSVWQQEISVYQSIPFEAIVDYFN